MDNYHALNEIQSFTIILDKNVLECQESLRENMELQSTAGSCYCRRAQNSSNLSHLAEAI